MVIDDPTRAALAAAQLPPPRVLVVDDEETVTVTLQGILELDGYSVTASTSGEIALELMRTHPFEVVLTDLRMDGVDGLDLLRELHTISPDSVAIVLTGDASLAPAVQGRRAGARDHPVNRR